MAHERAILLATAHGEADEAAHRVFALEGELKLELRTGLTVRLKRNFQAWLPRWLLLFGYG
jgi:hypothetical protein